MAQTFLSLPLPPGGGGPGAPMAIPVASPHKTFLVAGQWEAFAIILEVSADGVHWDGIASFGQQSQPPKSLTFSANWARCNVRGLISGTPVASLAVDTVAVGATQATEIPLDGPPVNVSAYENKHKTFLVSASEANRDGVVLVEGSGNGGANWEPLFTAQGQDRDAPYSFDGYLDFVRARALRGTTAGMRVDIVTEPFECGDPPPVLACDPDALPFDGDIGNVWVEGPLLAVARQEIVSALTHEGSQYRAMFAGGQNVGNPNGVADVDAYTWAALPGIGKDNAFATPMQIAEYGIAPNAITLEDCPVVIPTPSFGGDEPLLESPSLYDPDTNTWSLGNAPGNSQAQFNRGGRGAQILLANGTILVMNAGGNPTASIYNPATDAWSSPVGSNSPTYAYGPGFAAIRLADGRVLVCGGNDGFSATNDGTIYDPVANLWTSAALMTDARENHALVLLDDGRVLAISGQQGFSVTYSTEIYDPVANTWTPTASLNSGRYNFGASKLPNGDVIVVGGNDGAVGPQLTTEIYDVSAGTWSYGPFMNYARDGVAGALVAMPDTDQAGLIVAGGFGRPPAMVSFPNADLDTVEYLTIGSFFPFGRLEGDLSAFLASVVEEQVEAPSPGDPGSFTCAINWDDLPGDMVRAIFSMSATSVSGFPATERLIIKVYAGGVPPSNNPGAIVGTNILEMSIAQVSGLIRIKGGMYFPKPTGRSTLITTWRTSTGGNIFLTGSNPILTVQTRVLGESALLLVGAPTPSTTGSTQPNAWVVNFDLFDTPNIMVSMSGFTRTALAAASANIEAQIDGNPAVPSGTTIASYSLIGQQSPLDEWQITGNTVVIPNPGGLRHFKLAPTGDAATEIRNMSVIIRAVSP